MWSGEVYPKDETTGERKVKTWSKASKAGNILNNMPAWCYITSDKWVLGNVKHDCKIDFEEDCISDKVVQPYKIQFSQAEVQYNTLLQEHLNE